MLAISQQLFVLRSCTLAHRWIFGSLSALGVIRSLWPLFHVSNEVKFTINKIFRNETSLVEPSWVELYGQVTVRSPWSTFYAWLTLDNVVTYVNYTILYPTQWVGGILESPCPSVRHNFVAIISLNGLISNLLCSFAYMMHML